MTPDDERRRYSDLVLERLEEQSSKTLEMISEIREKQGVIAIKINGIEIQTNRTNGRVSDIEDENITRDAWINETKGSFKIVCWIVAVFGVAIIGTWVDLWLKGRG